MSNKKIAVMVTTPPYSVESVTALNYCSAALARNQLVGVFFYQAGVVNADAMVKMANDELNAQKQWQALSEQHQVPLYLCVTAAEKRGLVENQAGKLTHLAQNFIVSGLGEMVSLTNQADIMVQL